MRPVAKVLLLLGAFFLCLLLAVRVLCYALSMVQVEMTSHAGGVVVFVATVIAATFTGLMADALMLREPEEPER